MRSIRHCLGLFTVIATVALTACSTSKMVVLHQQVAKQMEADGNYAAATDSWSKYFEEQSAKGNEIAAENYAQAAKVALKADRKDLALTWFEQASMGAYSDPEMQVELAKIYRDKNETMKELSALQTFREKFATATGMPDVNGRLFEIFAMLKDEQSAKATWGDLTGEQKHQKIYLEEYFKLILKEDDAAAIEAIAKDLVEVDPTNVRALEWLGETYYHKAETSYKAEMKAYEKKHTHLQYLHLTQELKVINTNFQKSSDCFSKLWEMEQKKTYATYLANIYTRFDNKTKADYFRKFIN